MCSVVALFVSVSSSVTAFEVASGRASITVGVVSIITLLFVVTNAITARWESAVGSAWSTSNVSVLGTEVTLFVDILDAISTVCESAVGSACSWFNVIVEGSIVALFSGGGVDNTITTRDSAVGGTLDKSSDSGSVLVSEIALLSQAGIEDAITANWQLAVGSASTVSVSVVGSRVALLVGSVGHQTISASEAASWRANTELIVEESVIAVLAEVGNSVAASWESAARSAGV